MGLNQTSTNTSHVQHLIKHERVIETDLLHVAAPDENDPDSAPVGNLITFNVMEREYDFVKMLISA